MTLSIFAGRAPDLGPKPVPGDSGDGLVTSRFQVVAGSQQLAASDLLTVVWPVADVDWDDIGFELDYSTNGSFFLSPAQNCELWIAAYVQLNDDGGGGSTGTALLDVETASGDPPDLVAEKNRIPISPDGVVDLITTGLHRFYAGLPGTFRVQVHTFDMSNAPVTIAQASLSIMRVRTIAPLGS